MSKLNKKITANIHLHPFWKKFIFSPAKVLFRSAVWILFIALMPAYSSGQTPYIHAITDSQNILIGDQFHLYLSAEFNKQYKIHWPLLADSAGNFEILKRGPVDSTVKDRSIKVEQRFTLTNFDPGTHYIPSIPLTYRKTGDTTFSTALTDSLRIVVRAMKVDTAKAIKPIKEPLEVPYTFKELVPYILAGILILALIALAIYIWRKKKKRELPPPPPKPGKPPHQIALEKLNRLEENKVWQKGDIKEYHEQLTYIIREYMEARFHLNALELTSDEILHRLRYRKELIEEQLEQIQSLFHISDRAKFAKANPGPHENERTMEVARTFVKATGIKTAGETM